MRFNLWILFLVGFAASAHASQHLMLVGGGNTPPEAIERFCDWSGGRSARFLVIAWAGSDSALALKKFKSRYEACSPASVSLAPDPEEFPARKAEFLQSVSESTGIFFSGGVQLRIMTVLKDVELLEALQHRYREGAAFGGTSAGTAIMSQRMITGFWDPTKIDGESVRTLPGLGLLPKGVLVDQHFVRRRRENRLNGLMLQRLEYLGLGIDEGSALAITDNRVAEVLGPSYVVAVSPGKEPNSLRSKYLKKGQTLSLNRSDY